MANGQTTDNDKASRLHEAVLLLDEAAEAVQKLDSKDRRRHIPSTVLEQYFRAKQFEKSFQFCKDNPHFGYVVLRGCATIGEHYAQQGDIKKARAAMDAIFELEAQGASESNPNYMVIAKAVVATLTKASHYDRALKFAEDLPVWNYSGGSLSKKDIAAFHVERQSTLIKQIIIQALRQGDVLRASETIDSLTPKYRIQYSRYFASAFANAGAYDLAREQLSRYPKSYRRKGAIQGVIIAFCERGDYREAIATVHDLKPAGLHYYLALVVNKMHANDEEPALRQSLVEEILQQPIIDIEVKKHNFRFGNLLVDHMMDGGDELRFMKVFSTAFRNEPSMSATHFRLRRILGDTMLNWIRTGQQTRFEALSKTLAGETIEQAKRRRGFYGSILGRLNQERFVREKANLPDQDQQLRRQFARQALQAWIGIPANDPYDKSYGTDVYDSMSDSIDHKLFRETMRYLRDQESGSRLFLQARLAAPMLLHSPTRETDRFLDRYITNPCDGSMYPSYKFLVAKLSLGFNDSAANYFSKASLTNEKSFLVNAGQMAIGTPAFEPLCQLMRQQWKGDWKSGDCNDWGSYWYKLPPAGRLSTAETFLEYYPASRWARLKRCQALAALGRVKEAIGRGGKIDPVDQRFFHFSAIVDSACQAGHAPKLTSLLDTMSEPHQKIVLNELCPHLAKTDPAKAIELARSIKETGDRAYALSLIASAIMDKELGPEN